MSTEYRFKKISDVGVIETANESAHVIIEDAGILKRMAAKNIGAVKTVNGAAPDADGNVQIEAGGASSWNDLTDKPFYETPVVIEWDGSTEGREVFSLPLMGEIPLNFYKVSNTYIPANTFIGGTMIVSGVEDVNSFATSQGEEEILPAEVKFEKQMISEEAGMVAIGVIPYLPLIVSMPNENSMSVSEGVYALLAEAEVMNQIFDGSGLTFEENIFMTELRLSTVHKLDPKFLPENGFGYEEGELVIISNDIDVDNADIVYMNEKPFFVKISEKVIDPNNLIGGTIEFIADGEVEESYEINNDNFEIIMDMDDMTGVSLGRVPLYIVKVDNCTIEGTTFQKKGIYTMYQTPPQSVIFNITYGLVIHKIDKKFLPSTLPDITADNNGQILGVTEGAWVVMDAPSGIPEVTADNEGAFLRIIDGVPTWVVLEIAEDGEY